MIVQSAPADAPHFVITMADHTDFAGKLAEAFGNDDFAPVAPRAEMLYVIGHHDSGWQEWDQAPGLDPETRLPYHLVRTPFANIIKTSGRSPENNESHHPFCGLLSSMHSWGLYNGRYGLSDHVLLDGIASEHRAAADAMLDNELARQDRIKAKLGADPETAPWIEEDRVFQNYKQLQFCDTLSLYFHMTHADARGEASFPNVPRNSSEDVTVELRPLGSGVYGLAPYPFAEDGLELAFRGRYLAPLADDETTPLGTLLESLAEEAQTVRLVAN